MKRLKKLTAGLCLITLLGAGGGCATTTAGKIATGMLVGAVVGAAVGHEFVHHGAHKEYETRNTIITSIVFALGTGGVMGWHYQQMEQQTVDISGRYSRYRLCNSEDMHPDLGAAYEGGKDEKSSVYQIPESQVGKLSISLDDNTKWVYPSFRKRFLMPELGENHVLSNRYIWEILKPGSFVTRSQNPQYFLEMEKK
jgi:hypothetical protein